MKNFLILIITVVLVAGAVVGSAGEVTLHQVTFPERKSIGLDFDRKSEAPEARVEAKVEYREGRAFLEVKFKDMKPAILFGGDVTSFVLWAVPREGRAENLGEVWVRKTNEEVSYSTALKSFGLLITAEAFPLVSKPSELVMFLSGPAKSKKAQTDTFVFAGLQPAPAIDFPSIARVEWRQDRKLDLEQAVKAQELAVREGGNQYASELMQEAATALAQATSLSSSGGSKKATIDYSRRSVDLSAEAIRISIRRKEAEALEMAIAERQAVMDGLEARAAEAEAMALAASASAVEAESARAAASESLADAELRQAAAEGAVLASQIELADLSRQAEQLAIEKEEIADRLQGALSLVAETHAGARGMIVNLPDILFATNEAEIKTEAKIVIAKLAGILLIMPELNLRIEGHTDSTGSLEWNDTLSQKRSLSVESFLAGEGIGPDRMVAEGYGPNRPVADNVTKEGRSKNRRVEIIIAEGEVAEAE